MVQKNNFFDLQLSSFPILGATLYFLIPKLKIIDFTIDELGFDLKIQSVAHLDLAELKRLYSVEVKKQQKARFFEMSAFSAQEMFKDLRRKDLLKKLPDAETVELAQFGDFLEFLKEPEENKVAEVVEFHSEEKSEDFTQIKGFFAQNAQELKEIKKAQVKQFKRWHIHQMEDKKWLSIEGRFLNEGALEHMQQFKGMLKDLLKECGYQFVLPLSGKIDIKALKGKIFFEECAEFDFKGRFLGLYGISSAKRFITQQVVRKQNSEEIVKSFLQMMDKCNTILNLSIQPFFEKRHGSLKKVRFAFCDSFGREKEAITLSIQRLEDEKDLVLVSSLWTPIESLFAHQLEQKQLDN